MLATHAGNLEKATCPNALWQGAVDVLGTFGFEQVIYLGVDAGFRNLFVRTTMPDLYTQTPPVHDPFLVHACSRYEIMTLGVEFISDHPYITQPERAFIVHASAQGLRAGIGIPMRLKGAPRFGGFILGNRMDRATFLEQMMPRAGDIRMFCMVIHRRNEELAFPDTTPHAGRQPLAPASLPAAFDRLTPRETEVLLLLSHGKTRQQTAHICGLSVHTVSDYAKSGYKKLGVRNRAEVAALLLARQTAIGG